MCGAVDMRSIFVSMLLFNQFSLIYRAVDLWRVDVWIVDVESGWSIEGIPTTGTSTVHCLIFLLSELLLLSSHFYVSIWTTTLLVPPLRILLFRQFILIKYISVQGRGRAYGPPMATMTRQQFCLLSRIPQNFVSPQGTIKAAGNMTFGRLNKKLQQGFSKGWKKGSRKYFGEIWWNVVTFSENLVLHILWEKIWLLPETVY